MNTRTSELHIEGYRTLKDASWRPGALNVVIGPNGSGKSNLLKALAMMSASARGMLQGFVDEDGGMGSILWNSAARMVAFTVNTEFREGTSYASTWSYRAGLVRTGQSASYRIDHEHIGPDDAGGSTTSNAGTSSTVETTLSEQYYRPGESREPTVADAEWYAVYSEAIPYRTPEAKAIKEALVSWQVLDDLQFGRQSRARSAVTARYIDRLEPNGENLSSVMHTLYEAGDDFGDRVDDAMRAAFGDEFVKIVFPPTGGVSNIQLAVKWKSVKAPVATNDLSDGTLRFLAIIGALAHPNPPALIAIDEPETGLHPSMMRIIAEHARDAALRSQVMFTTHSAAFLDAFGQTEPPTTSVTELRDGATSIRTLDPEEIAYWLKNYTLGDLYNSTQLEWMGTQE